MLSECVTSLTNGCSEMLTGLCEAGWEEPSGETFAVFLGCYSRSGGGALGGYKDSNLSFVFEGFYESDECAKSSKWLNYSNG